MRPATIPTPFRYSGGVFIDAGYEEVILPAIWEQQTFIEKAGPEIVKQMWAFEDKGNRPVCLIPEVTGLVQELWRDDWSKRERSKRIFYTSRCYRYERPQAGRYREFTQFGCEVLGDVDKDEARASVINALLSCLNRVGVRFEFVDSVKRGLSYYVEDGFEAIAEQLGAQKQIAGGGRYAEGIGWAIGVDRLLLAREQNNDESS